MAMAVLLLPWLVYLGFALPSRAVAHHYNLAWAGFDVALVFALARTAWLAAHGRRQVELPAVATATLLIVDAWFDVTTAGSGWPLIQAVTLAVLVELPTAGLAIYISRRVERLTAEHR